MRHMLAPFALSFIVSSAFPLQAQRAINAYTLMLPSFNIISEYAPIIEYDALKVFAFILANNLAVLAVIALIGRFGLSFFHSIAFGAVAGALCGSWMQLHPAHVAPLLVYSAMEGLNYATAAGVMMRSAQKAYGFASFRGAVRAMVRDGPSGAKEGAFRDAQRFIVRASLPLTAAIAFIETILVAGAL